MLTTLCYGVGLAAQTALARADAWDAFGVAGLAGGAGKSVSSTHGAKYLRRVNRAGPLVQVAPPSRVSSR